MGDKPQLVDANIADLIVDNTDYTYEPVSEEAEIRKENRAKLAEKYPMDFEGTVSPMEKSISFCTRFIYVIN